jgi:hypothetical protein
MRISIAAAGSLALIGCVPTLQMPQGPEHERLTAMVRQFCDAERSADPYDSALLLAAGVVGMLDELPLQDASGGRRYLTSADPSARCEPGRSWYRGGSRMFAEVRLADRSDRLDVWRGDAGRIHNILYGKPRRVAGRKALSLREALLLEIAANRAAPPAPPPPDPECYPGNYHFAFLATDTQVYRQGATVKIAPTIDIAPGGTQAVPLKCVSDWSLSGPASLSADRSTLTIAPDAAPGSAIRVGFVHAGKTIAAEFRVVGRDEIVLTGRYSQKSVTGCEVGEPVRELEFTPGNRFSVTFMPFETYRDYWGSYLFDPATGKLQFKVEGGNFQPPGLDLEGEAKLSGGVLVLRDMFLGNRGGAPQTGCTYTF